jgi:UDP-N-acetylglucosamine acyltransferase
MSSSVIHPTASVDPGAQLGENVVIGPYCLIEKDTIIGNSTTLNARVHIKRYSSIGHHCTLDDGVVVGGLPQDLKYKGEVSYATVGDHTTLREYVTIHRATGEGETTQMGSHCFIMAYAHVGHNSVVGDHVIMANTVQVAGHVEIGHHVVIGGMSALHQHVKMGPYSMLGGVSATRQDIPPFCIADGHTAKLYGLNVVGLRRNGFSASERSALKSAYKILFYNKDGQPLQARIEQVETEWAESPCVQELLQFIKVPSKRGFCTPNQVSGPSTESAGIEG